MFFFSLLNHLAFTNKLESLYRPILSG